MILLGSLSVAYVLVRPFLLTRSPHIAIAEYPLGALFVALALWAALARPPTREEPPVWRRHEQVVRQLPDPALAADLATLERWLATGASPEAAAEIIARGTTNDPRERERIAHALTPTLTASTSRRKRESILKTHAKPGA